MAKKNSNPEAGQSDLMTADEGGTALAVAPQQQVPAARPPVNLPSRRLEGEDKQDVVIPRVHVYQGLPSEAKQYGKGFNPGDLINTVTGEKIGTGRFTPICGYKQFIKWKDPRGSGLEYSFTDKRQVPPEDLEWQDHQPPPAQEYINWVVLFEGHETPLVLSFTKTSLGAGRTINTCETLRGKKGPGLYAVEMLEKSNDKGAWVAPKIRPAGDPSSDDLSLVCTLFESMRGVQVRTNDDSEDSGGCTDGFDPESV